MVPCGVTIGHNELIEKKINKLSIFLHYTRVNLVWTLFLFLKSLFTRLYDTIL